MGICVSSPREIKVLLVGLDGAGKTTILNKLHTGETTAVTVPTYLDVEQISYKNMKMTFWDLGGSENIRKALFLKIRVYYFWCMFSSNFVSSCLVETDPTGRSIIGTQMPSCLLWIQLTKRD